MVGVVENFGYLGLRMDSHLNWSLHCEQLCRRIRSVVGILFKLRNILSLPALLQIYHSFVHSHLTYMVEIWADAPACYLRPLQVLQNRCLKIVYGLDVLTPSVLLYSHYAQGILPIKGLQELYINKFMKQVMNNEIHHTLDFPHRNLVRTIRNPRGLFETRPRTSFGSRMISSRGPRLYNELPRDIRDIRETRTFVRALKSKYCEPEYIERFLRL